MRARVRRSDGRGRGGKGGQGGRDGSAAGGEAPGVQEVKERTPGDNLSFILKSTLISDVYFSCSGSNCSATTTKSLLHPQVLGFRYK